LAVPADSLDYHARIFSLYRKIFRPTHIGNRPSHRWQIVWMLGWRSRVSEYRNKIANTRFCCAIDRQPITQDAPPSMGRSL
jgi:hypothetical protein